MAGLLFFDGPRWRQRWDVPAIGGGQSSFLRGGAETTQAWEQWQQRSLERRALWHGSGSCFKLRSPGFVTCEMDFVLPLSLS